MRDWCVPGRDWTYDAGRPQVLGPHHPTPPHPTASASQPAVGTPPVPRLMCVQNSRRHSTPPSQCNAPVSWLSVGGGGTQKIADSPRLPSFLTGPEVGNVCWRGGIGSPTPAHPRQQRPGRSLLPKGTDPKGAQPAAFPHSGLPSMTFKSEGGWPATTFPSWGTRAPTTKAVPVGGCTNVVGPVAPPKPEATRSPGGGGAGGVFPALHPLLHHRCILIHIQLSFGWLDSCGSFALGGDCLGCWER